jgi:hypothetical protein
MLFQAFKNIPQVFSNGVGIEVAFVQPCCQRASSHRPLLLFLMCLTLVLLLNA